MKRNHLILILCLCIVIAALGAGYVIFGGNDDDSSSDSEKSVSDENDTDDMFDENINDIFFTAPDDEDTSAESNDSDEEKITAVQTTKEPTTAKKPTSGEINVPESDYEYAYAGFNPSTAVINSEKWYLLLVNRNYILPEDFTVKTTAVKGGGQSLDYRVTPYYDKMVAAAEADGISLIPVSGYRSVERQRTNFERKIKLYMDKGYSKAEATRLASEIVLMPSTSEHNAGLAMDFGTNGNYTLDENFAKTEAFRWLSENAADYGFILRYPEDAQDITMVTYEPWHWRYVGVENAKKIKASGLTLEEYLGMD
ncbi:MAG: M15 family metallopeptidase [Clostridia bacterium]|nr:M15 family metallopeptidase [Clostridia bacterium]